MQLLCGWQAGWATPAVMYIEINKKAAAISVV
jgi:hypothetical protein